MAAPTFTHLFTSADPAAVSTPITTATVTVAADELILVGVTCVNGSTARTALVTGSGLTFTKHVEGSYDTLSDTISLHSAKAGAGGFSGTLTITMSNSVQQMHWGVTKVSGQHLTTPVPQTVAVAIGTGTTFTAGTLGSAVNTDSRTVIAAAHLVAQAVAAGTSMTLLGEFAANSPAHSFGVSRSTSAFVTTPTMTAATGAAWGCVALELAAVAGGTPQTVTPTAVAGVGAVPAPTAIVPGTIVTPTAVAGIGAVQAPVLSVPINVAPAAVAGVGAVPAPTVTAVAPVALAPAFIRSGYGSNTTAANATSKPITPPTLVADGDLLVCFVGSDSGAVSIGEPPSFSLITGTTEVFANAFSSSLSSRAADNDGTGATMDVTLGAAERISGMIVSVAQTAGVHGTAQEASGADGTNVAAPTITTSVNNCLIVYFLAYDNAVAGAIVDCPSGGPALYQQQETASGATTAIYYEYQAVAGTTTARTFTVNQASRGYTHRTVAFAPRTAPTDVEVRMLTGEYDGTDGTSYTFPDVVTPEINDLLMAVIVSAQTSPTAAPAATVSGLGLTWTQVGTLQYDANNERRMQVFTAPAGSAPLPGLVSVSYGSTAVHMSGVVLGLRNANATLVQCLLSAVTTGTGPTLTNVLSAGASTDSRPIGVFAHRSNEYSTRRTNWKELVDVQGSAPAANLEVQWRPDAFEQTTSTTWTTSSTSAYAAIEVAKSVAGAVTVTPTAVAGTGAVGAPVLTATAVVAPAAVAATATVPAPAFATSTAVAPAAVAGTGTVQAPTAVIPGGVPSYPSSGAKIETWREDFAAGSPNAWYTGKSASGWTWGSGVLALAMPPASSEYWFGHNATEFDLSASYVFVEVPSVTLSGGGLCNAVLQLWLDSNNHIEIGLTGTGGSQNLTFWTRQAGTSNNYSGTAIPYNATNHRWWRISLSGTTLTFETSADGTTWSNPFGVTRTVSGTWYQTLSVFFDITATGSGSGSITFDNVNVPPAGGPTTVTASAVAATGAVRAPTFLAPAFVTPSVVAATGSVGAPAPSAAAIVVPAAVGATGAVPAPSIRLTVTPAAVTAIGAVQAPGIAETVLPAAVTAPGAVLSPSLVLTPVPVPVGAVGAVQAPVAVAGSGQTIAPAVVAALGTVGAPVLTATATLTAVVVSALGSVGLPTVSTTAGATPAVVGAIGSVPAPGIATKALPSAVAGTGNVGLPTTVIRSLPSAVAAVGTVGVPIVVLTVLPGPVTGLGAVGAPTVTATAVVTPSAIVALGSVNLPLFAGGAVALPAVIVAAGAVQTPVILTSSPATALPSVVIGVGVVQTPVETATAVVAPTVVTGIGTVNLPTFAGGAVALPTTIVANGSVGSPAFTITAKVTPTAVVAVGVVQAPTVQVATTPAPVSGAGAVRGPTISAAAVVIPAVVSGVGAVQAPSILTGAGATAAPVVIVAIATIEAPSLVLAITFIATPVNAAGAVRAPTLLVSEPATAFPAAISATGTVQAPVLRATATVTPTAIAALGNVGAPAVSSAVIVTPATVTAIGAVGAASFAATSVAAPTVIVGLGTVNLPSFAGGAVGAPAVITALALVNTPVASVSRTVTPQALVAIGIVQTPALRYGGIATPVAVSATGHVLTPSLVVYFLNPHMGPVIYALRQTAGVIVATRTTSPLYRQHRTAGALHADRHITPVLSGHRTGPVLS